MSKDKLLIDDAAKQVYNLEKFLETKREVLVGRGVFGTDICVGKKLNPNSPFAKELMSVSREHAKISYSSSLGDYIIEDIGSKNGTLICRSGENSSFLGKGSKDILTKGCKIFLGNYPLRFEESN